MNKVKLAKLEENFQAFILPLLDQDGNEDYGFVWEFEKFFHSKKLQVLTAEKEALKQWKEQLLSK
jgi:hypothetical protein